MGTPGITLFGGVALLTLAAPFELTEPLVRFPRQSVSTLEAALLLAFAAWGAAIVVVAPPAAVADPADHCRGWRCSSRWSSRPPRRRSRATNALHMTGRLTAALGVYLLAVNGLTTRARLRAALALAVAVGVVVSVLAILEYLGVRPVLDWLTAFRPGVATVGAQVRAGGPLQYPTIASMYLEVVFAFGLGVLLSEHDDAAAPDASAPRRRVVRRPRRHRRGDHADVHTRRADHDGVEPRARRRDQAFAARSRWRERGSSPASRW